MGLRKQKLLYIRNILFLSTIVACLSMHAREGGDENKQIRIGNFAVDGTMQPGPLLGFGQNIIDQCDALAILYPITILGKHKSLTEVAPEILYGLRDDLSIFLAFPTAVRFKENGHHSSGSIDTILQLEYALYAKHRPKFTNLITAIGAMYFPTGDECKNPATGFGSPSFFLGMTAVHLATEWYAYTSYAAFLTTKNMEDVKFGNNFFYQFGFGRNIAYSSEKWTLMWMLELSGTYTQKTKINSIIDPNSGSNTVYIGPALWFSTQRFVLEVGAAPVVSQHLFGKQPAEAKSSVLISAYTGIRF